MNIRYDLVRVLQEQVVVNASRARSLELWESDKRIGQALEDHFKPHLLACLRATL